MSRKKLLKLVYYAQAWSLVWDERPLFGDDVIEAWPEGPVARKLWIDDRHGGAQKGDPEALNADERATIDEVLRFYGRFNGDQLSDLTHHEAPWQDARRDLSSSAASRNVVTADSMRAYYGQFKTKPKKLPSELARGIEVLLSLPPDERASMFEPSGENAAATLDKLLG